MRFLKTFIQWQFWVSILLMFIVCFGLYHFIFKVWLESYTNHNQEIELPDLKTMTIDEALATLDGLGLTYEVDSVRFDPTQKAFAVLDFYPEKGFKVKHGRKILIKSNPSGWKDTFLPDIVGKSKRLAFTQLRLAGLEVGDTIYQPDLAKDAVLSVMFNGRQIEKDYELPRFSKVDIVLGKGLEFGVKTPNLIGLLFDEAKSAIFANRFDLGRMIVEGNVQDSAALQVFYQYPIAGDNYDQGLPVDLWLTSEDPKELKTIIKDLDKQYRNFGGNDSLAIEMYHDELHLDKTVTPSNQPKSPKTDPIETNEQPKEQNSTGFEVD